MPARKNLVKAYNKAIGLILEADCILVTSGAGLGVDSGLPDFRGKNGFYKAYPAFANSELQFYDVANPSFLNAKPDQFWWFYAHRYQLYTQKAPHAGYRLLTSLIENKNGFVFTSNVDGYFSRAGVSNEKIVECHGSINRLQCSTYARYSAPKCADIWAIDSLPIVATSTPFELGGTLPTCPSCGAVARPNILMFNDKHWNQKVTERQLGLFNRWLEDNQEKKMIALEIGAGQSIPTVRWQSESLGIPIIRINPDQDDSVVYDEFSVSIPETALEALTHLNYLIGKPWT